MEKKSKLKQAVHPEQQNPNRFLQLLTSESWLTKTEEETMDQLSIYVVRTRAFWIVFPNCLF
jgi:hypothetical protein